MGAMGLVFLTKFLGVRAAFACLIIGALCQGLGGIADRFHFWEGGFTPEEVAETSASGLYLLAVLQYAYRDLVRFATFAGQGSRTPVRVRLHLNTHHAISRRAKADARPGGQPANAANPADAANACALPRGGAPLG